MKRLQEEEKLHAAAIAWLSSARGYDQKFEDPDEATNARLDSIGVIQDQPWFIEVKVSIGPVEARHIESKISGSLRGHADPNNDHPQFVAMRKIWDGCSVPLFATIARKHTVAGSRDLSRILRKRSSEWMFDYEILEWTGSKLKILERGTCPIRTTRNPSLSVAEVKLPPSKREANATFDQLRDTAIQRGVLDLFDHAMSIGIREGFKQDFRVTSVTLTKKRGTGWMRVMPGESNAKKGIVLECQDPIMQRIDGLTFVNHGRGRYTYSRIAVSDPETLTRIIEAASLAWNDVS